MNVIFVKDLIEDLMKVPKLVFIIYDIAYMRRIYSAIQKKGICIFATIQQF